MKKWITIVMGTMLATIIVGCGKVTEDVIVPKEPTVATEQELTEEVSIPETEAEEAETIVGEITEWEEEIETSIVSDTLSVLRVEGTQLVDGSGNAVQLRGVSTHGIAWFPQYVNQQFFIELREEWKADIVRLAMYTAENGGYCSGGDQEALKQLVKDGVNYATNAGLYVIVDWHILRDVNPNQNKEEAKQFFEEMSKEFSEFDNVIYEICNEPNGGTTWEEIKAYAEEVISVIRANDEDAVIIVGTPTWSQDVDKAAEDPIEGYENIMYALHFYAATHTDWLRNRMCKAVDCGLPIFVTEFGTCDASGDGGIDEAQSNKWIQAMDECGISYVAWNLSNKAETSAIFVPGCQKTSGFVMEDLSENGKWIYEMLSGEHAETINESADEDISLGDTGASETETGSIEGVHENFIYTAAVVNSWEADGQTFSQYSLTIENPTEQDMDTWSVELSFDRTITFSDGWNASYTADNTTLMITPTEYNARIPSGGAVSDIGFIISMSMN